MGHLCPTWHTPNLRHTWRQIILLFTPWMVPPKPTHSIFLASVIRVLGSTLPDLVCFSGSSGADSLEAMLHTRLNGEGWRWAELELVKNLFCSVWIRGFSEMPRIPPPANTVNGQLWLLPLFSQLMDWLWDLSFCLESGLVECFFILV